ncbi:ferredoxin-thioredoxin reductase catalytic domain-containing protein [Candidatus Bathycorpusculum sp.]|uniref:ferredoxin-thioredoxin reductase catalytic domain-containing protein n=1 Tax=Candidatus Bathycorpusculum sp. TaxID=2994959 RepID=UPI00282D131D|nr:ferredoxin:glutaredoxin reductase [Candidatus Termitimicrobium sp.]MCL2432052.1 ferredoxin:glutaredoxin reductase [Candidatus Termitimicrobium sp.]
MSLTLETVRKRAEADAKNNGYYLIPQTELLQMFLEGLKTNEERFGYPVCPCRLGTGNIDTDRDIICPCDYRDPDVAQYGACYCRLYVNKTVYESQNLPEVPERRPPEKMARAYNTATTQQQTPTTNGTPTKPQTQITTQGQKAKVEKNLWYCKQCGYVVYREDPPYVCPICKAKQEMFTKIDANIEFKG